MTAEPPGIDETVFGPGREVFVERSVKLSRRAVQADRVLYGIARDGATGLRARVLGLAEALNLPAEARRELELRFGDAHMVHAGQEGLGPTATRKLYLEFARPPADLPGLRFVAWKTARGRALRSTYTRRPLPERYDMLPEPMAHCFAAATKLARTATPMLLEVAEPGTPRASLDLNLYDAGLTLAEAMPALAPALSALGHKTVPGFAPNARLGHLSAGTGRDGAPFLTIYGDAKLVRAAA